ncbi:MAG: UDP-galactopyranose mutase [Chitinophagaceae bacterium]|nr:UDP-galactopyranose mutase [Chitinophagaceae bacterium]
MKTAVIIGAGPAGLTAAYELLTKTDIIPVIIENDNQVGGLSKTINYKGNKIDIGGHRFFSKSKKVIDWWLHFLPLDPTWHENKINLRYQNKNAGYAPEKKGPAIDDKLMLVRKRKSRIFYNRKFFDYPLRLSGNTISNLGLIRMCHIGFSYLYAKLFPEKPEHSLEHYFKNHFGNELYQTFFKDYTEKVWGVPCNKLPASWGQQRVKDLNISKVIIHAVKSLFTGNKSIDQSGTDTSLIEQFLYPQYGPGQMWETVAEEIIKLGGTIFLNTRVSSLYGDGKDKIVSLETKNNETGEIKNIKGDYFFSTIPVKELVANCHQLPIPDPVRQVASSLEYRDFLIVGLLASGLSLKDKNNTPVTDNWIYIQDKNVKAGRLQFFHNWSPFMVNHPGDSWIGVEYFCNATDSFWQLEDPSIISLVIKEMETLGILNASLVKDALVVRVQKAYPSYFGGYENFEIVRRYVDTIENLFLIGRNGMHRYNNSDHSMLTAMAAVDNIIAGNTNKTNIWDINTEEEYHEENKS